MLRAQTHINKGDDAPQASSTFETGTSGAYS